MLGTIIGLLAAGCGKKQLPDEEEPPIVETNTAPIAHAAFIPGDPSFVSGDLVRFDLRYREHGCDSGGAPTWATGAWDPDGDPLEYRVTCEWSVYTATYEKVNDQWITFPEDDRGEQLALVTIIIGWQGEIPPYPFGTQDEEPNLAAMGCDPGVQQTPFTYAVRDGRGGMTSYTVVLGGS